MKSTCKMKHFHLKIILMWQLLVYLCIIFLEGWGRGQTCSCSVLIRPNQLIPPLDTDKAFDRSNNTTFHTCLSDKLGLTHICTCLSVVQSNTYPRQGYHALTLTRHLTDQTAHLFTLVWVMSLVIHTFALTHVQFKETHLYWLRNHASLFFVVYWH